MLPTQPPAAISPPLRRPVAQMREVIGAHAPGDEWTVQFRSPIFGVYCIGGPVHRSAVVNELRIGLALVTSGGLTPASRVLNIWPGRADLLQVDADDCDPAAVQHGDLVRARTASYGDELTVIGHAITQLRNDLVGVGHHTIRSPSGVARTLRSLSAVRGMSFNPPPALHAWSDADGLVSERPADS